MRYQELFESKSASLYHGYRHIDKAIIALNNNEMLATTSQRFWRDGLRRKDNDPDYQNSFWMKGISTTRDLNFAQAWGEIVLILDQEKLSQTYKILPFNWGYSIPQNNNHKREREEFIVLKNTYDTYMDQHPDDAEDDPPYFNVNRLKSPEGAIKPLSRYLLGITMDEDLENLKENDLHKEPVEKIKNHPLFKGFYHFPKR